jgi:integral membrane protein
MAVNKEVRDFRLSGIVEGLSFLILIFVAMPMKYIFGIYLAVKIVGMAHGVLFILFCFLFVRAMFVSSWSLFDKIYLFSSSLIPFGMIFMEKRLNTIAKG